MSGDIGGGLGERADRLASAMTQMAAAVDELGQRTGRSEADIARSRRLIRLTAAVVTLTVLLTVAVGSLAISNRRAGHRLDTQQREITTVQRDVLCPLYGLFAASYDPRSEDARRDPERYERSFAVIRRSAAALKCPGQRGEGG